MTERITSCTCLTMAWLLKSYFFTSRETVAVQFLKPYFRSGKMYIAVTCIDDNDSNFKWNQEVYFHRVSRSFISIFHIIF